MKTTLELQVLVDKAFDRLPWVRNEYKLMVWRKIDRLKRRIGEREDVDALDVT